MKVKEVMSANPVCCTANDTAATVAKMTFDLNVGSIPVVADQQIPLVSWGDYRP
jgi:CBS domain-containing protein